ncbi:hypothetical protein A5792_23460 [Mycolicibacterium peregrinum]|uniref:Uncharacterized protein n=1 Tax=Mycolicibacterium peregrinum TaxID=43304 RepID=A0A1A0R207_MYCPR|nr:hypothetical protein A5792_23460 [Mycolicibacterium peregrinum]
MVVVIVVVVVGSVVVVVAETVVVVGGVVVGCVNPTPEVVVGSEYAVVVVVMVVDGSGTVPVVGVCVVVGSVWSCCPPQATASTAPNASAAIPIARPTVDPTFIRPPTSVFTMVANLGRLRASIGLLDSWTSPSKVGLPLDGPRRAGMEQQSVAICGRFFTG